MSSLDVSRRTVAAAAVGVALACGAFGVSARAIAPVKRVALLGDSITSGYGLPARDALPVRLQGELARLGAPARVIPEGVVGDTTAGGAQRVEHGVGAHADLCVVALGGNDLLQGLDPKVTRANLTAIVRRLKARRIGVVLAGLTAPRAVGAGYARDFDAVFPAVARAERVALYPDLLAGVGPALRQGDGIHPNAAGVKVIAAHLAPVVARALKSDR
jgi:acyl-CoA thioesterase-1